jgi:signal transduction histidine kinase
MHYELGQFLTGLKMDIKWIEKKLPESKDNAATREKLTEMSKMVDDAVLFVRKLAAELRPSILDDLGLVAALEWHSQEFAKRFNIEVEFNSEVSDLATTPNIATGLFRMYQESLTNVARHASAKKVTAFLEVDEFIKLTIKDDGKGFDSSDIGDRKTLGLLGMRERAFMIGGKVDIISSPGEGTSIIIKIPLHKESSVLL